VHPLTVSGKWLTMTVIVVGVGVMAYTLLILVSYVVEGQLRAAVVTRHIRRRVRRLENHFILCGFGRVGGEIARDFTAERVPFVIIDVKQDSLERAAAQGHLVVAGNASDVDVLKEAGLLRARGLITAMDSDADNIFVTLSARVLRPDIFIVARANSNDSQPKLRLAGANRIISPYTIGGKRMASLAVRPIVVEFVESILSAGSHELVLEDFTIDKDSAWAGKTLDALAGGEDDATILAIKRGETMHFRPSAQMSLAAGDELVAAGPRTAIRELETRLQTPHS